LSAINGKTDHMTEALRGILKQASGKGGSPAVGYSCPTFPIEIIRALGLRPVRMASGGISPEDESRGEMMVRSDACSYCKGLLGLLSRKDRSDALIAYVISASCDQMRRTAERISREQNTPVALISFPTTRTESAFGYFLDQLRLATAELEQASGRHLDMEALRGEIGQSRAVAHAMTHAEESAPERPLDRWLLARIAESVSAGELLRIAGEYFPESKGALRQGGVLWIGSAYFPAEPVELEILQNKGIPVWDFSCSVTAPYKIDLADAAGADDPFVALARAYFEYSSCPRVRPMEAFLARLNVTVAQRSPKGIIVFSLPFCDNWKIVPGILREEHHIPVLSLDGNYSPSVLERTRTRIEAFLEMIGSTR